MELLDTSKINMLNDVLSVFEHYHHHVQSQFKSLLVSIFTNSAEVQKYFKSFCSAVSAGGDWSSRENGNLSGFSSKAVLPLFMKQYS